MQTAILLDADGRLVDGLSYATISPPYQVPHLANVGSTKATWHTGGTRDGVNDASNWIIGTDAPPPTGGSTPGAPNSTANAARIESLRPRPAISVSPTNHNFGTVLVKSDSTPLTVTVQNTGCLDLVVGQVALGGTHPDQFRLKNDQVSNSTIPPDRSATLQVVFHPTSVGAKSAVLTIPSNDPGYPTVTVTISGIGKAPPLSASVGGPYAGVVNVPVTLTVSASGGVPPCTFAWALNNDGLFDDAFGTIKGLNGFHLLCSQIDNTNGELRFILVNPAGEICTGTIARIGGEWLARGDPEFAIERVEVVDEANALLPSGSYAIRLGRAPSITPAKPIKQEKLCAGLRLRL